MMCVRGRSTSFLHAVAFLVASLFSSVECRRKVDAVQTLQASDMTNETRTHDSYELDQCTSQGMDPYASGRKVPCCPGLEKKNGDWDGSGRWYYLCRSILPHPCTSQGMDPYASGHDVPCCLGLEEKIGDWDGSGRWYYLCRSSPSSPRPVDECKVGVGFSLGFQKRRLDIHVAARKLKDIGVRCVRLYHYSSDYLQALWNAGIHDVMVNVPTHELEALSRSGPNSKALQVAQVLKPFYVKGMRFRVAVGNEPLASWESWLFSNAPLLLPSVENMHRALQQEGLSDATCTVAFYNGIIGTSYPPENGAFVPKHVETIRGLVDFIYRTGGEFVVHIYPWFARKGAPQHVRLDLALGKVENTINGQRYNGLLHQQIAAVRAALLRLDAKYATVPLSIGECGWPSKGAHEATLAHAREYTLTVIDASYRQDLPLDPHLGTIFLFEAFDEQGKAEAAHGGSSRETENNFGIMYESGELKYDVNFARAL